MGITSEEAIERTCRMHGQLKVAQRIIVGAYQRRWEDIVNIADG